MSTSPPVRRRLFSACLTVLSALALTTAALVPASSAQASTSSAQASNGPRVKNPYSPAYQHSYRHGVQPTLEQNVKMREWQRQHQSITPAAGSNLNYGGGVDGIGVTTGHEKVYLIFWGTQWGTASTNGSGDTVLSNDSAGAAPKLQEMFKGLGTNNELWSGVDTQYCEGIAAGSQSCPSNSAHVAYPTGGALSGVWYDNGAAEPSSATQAQLGQEAVKAASHFGNTTAAANRNAQYVILSATGAHPDGFPNGGWCAWHDWNGDVGVSSSVGDIAFTNMPYVLDSGTGCGQNFVNSGTAGNLDGFTMVEGHEYAETITDQNPAGGWTDSSGQENADKCAWLSPGTTGGAGNLTLATGTFAMQGTWSNDSSGCAFTHPIVGGGSGGNTVTVTNPGNQSTTVGASVSLQIQATDSSSGQTLTYSATGLPAGLSINGSTGLISGSPTTAGTYNVTVTASDTTGASGTASFTWTVNPSGGGCSSPGNKVGNGGFENGTAPWTTTSGVISANGSGESAHSGTYFAWLDGYGTTHTDSATQSVTIPSGCSASLTFWLHIDTSETTTVTAYDKLTVKVGGTTLATYSNLNAASGYTQRTFNVSSFAGQTVTLSFSGTEDASLQTSFVIDDVALNAS
jgi:Putative Ig domain